LTFEQCQSSGNSQGYYLNDVTYSSFTGCGSDQNLGYGYNLANIGGVTFNGCGAEINVSGSWVCSASTAIGSGKQISGVYGLVLSGCFTVGNGTGGGASSFLECVSLNSVPIQVTIDNCVDVASPNVISIIASGATSINRIGSLFAGAINLSGAATVNALLNTTPAADTLPYFDSVKTAATTSFPALGRAIAGLSTLTNHGILLGQAAAAPVATAAMTNGQLLVGQTGADPLPKTMSGDATLAASGALALISTITAGGPIGSATVTPIITYDANGRLITVSSATVTPAASSITGTLGADHGGTGLASYAIGDILYASATTTLAKLAGVATGNALISGGVTTAPSWGKIGLTTHISGTLPIANGGTNQTSLTTNSVLFYNGTSVQGTSAITWNGTILAVVGAGTNGFSMTGGHAANQGPYFFLADDTPQNIGIFGKEAAVLQGGSTASNFWVNAYVADLVFATNSTETFRIDRTSGLLKFVANSVNANGGTLMTLTSSSPGNASPQEWLKIKNTGGTTRYIPMY
jgi:hypothetical protein